MKIFVVEFFSSFFLCEKICLRKKSFVVTLVTTFTSVTNVKTAKTFTTIVVVWAKFGGTHSFS